MNGFTGQFSLKCSVDKLMLLDSGQTSKSFGDHAHLKMIATSGEILHRHRGIRDGALNGGLDRSRLNREQETPCTGC